MKSHLVSLVGSLEIRHCKNLSISQTPKHGVVEDSRSLSPLRPLANLAVTPLVS